ncbi:MAG: hypothetical protein LBR88_07565 [Zoogloeaceae bacterium]|jgi:predicted XRE-type DNA-binding protein|nr:hypothetical protein [Zoogloeaceae bacterium]
MNFKNIVSEIVASDMTQREIAAAVDTTQAHVSCLLSGKRKQPNWRLGDALLRLHRERCGTSKRRPAP